MPNKSGQPTLEELQENYCEGCNALLCDTCPISVLTDAAREAVEQPRALDDCPRRGGTKKVQNEGFVWVKRPACMGNHQ